MGSISALISMVGVQTSKSAASSSSGASQDHVSAFGEAVQVQIGTLSEADTGRIVDEWAYGASISGASYTSSGNSCTETGFEAYLSHLNIPIIENGKYTDGSVANAYMNGIANGTPSSPTDQMNNIMSYMKKNIQTAIDDQPEWQKREAVDLLMGAVTEFSKLKTQG